jgi:hypothetical protein
MIKCKKIKMINALKSLSTPKKFPALNSSVLDAIKYNTIITTRTVKHCTLTVSLARTSYPSSAAETAIGPCIDGITAFKIMSMKRAEKRTAIFVENVLRFMLMLIVTARNNYSDSISNLNTSALIYLQ